VAAAVPEQVVDLPSSLLLAVAEVSAVAPLVAVPSVEDPSAVVAVSKVVSAADLSVAVELVLSGRRSVLNIQQTPLDYPEGFVV
jgi:hypothetical protein